MPSLDDHFRALTRVRPPERWPDLGDVRVSPVAPPPRRPRPLLAAAIALLVAAGGIAVVVIAFHQSEPLPGAASSREAPSKTPGEEPSKTPSSNPTPSPAPDWAQGGVFGAMYDTITSASPAGWSFDLTHDRLDGDWVIDGNVDDGAGPGRLYVDVTTRPGNLQADPCFDSEFALSSPCETQHLANGDTLVLRDVHTDPGGTKTIEVVLIHPDRSGISAEAGNFAAPVLPGGSVSQGQLSPAQVTREDPLYTVGQLGKIMMAVDQAVQNCLRTSC
jgi:hypothetical protein